MVGRQIIADHREDRLCGSNFHLLGDSSRSSVQRSAEHSWEGQHIVDLVREIAAPGRDDRRVPLGYLRVDLRFRVGTGEHHPAGSHRGDRLLGDLPGRQPEEDVGAGECLSNRAGSALRIGPGGQFGLDVIEVTAAAVHDALGVDHRDIGESSCQQDVRTRHTRRTRAGDHHLQ